METDPVPCPQCGEWEQEVLRATKQHTTARCIECGNVFRFAPRALRMRDVGLVVSHDDVSTHHRIDLVTTDTVEIGSEFEAEGMRLLVTGIECMDGKRPEKALGQDIKSLFAKRFETVRIKYTINEGPTTRALQEEMDPDDSLFIGQKRTVQGVRVLIKTIKDDENNTRRKGEVLARNIRRVFCDPVAARKRRPGVHWGPPTERE